MSIVTALFTLGIALTVVGVVVAFASTVSMITSFDAEEATRSTRLFTMAAIAVLVGSFIVGLTVQGATA